MSMSNTVGATVRPVANDVPVTPMLTKPVFVCRHPPFGSGDPCSWYCQRALTLGFQQFPTDVSHGTGAGSVLAAVRSRGPADAVSGTDSAVRAATHSTIANMRRCERRSRSPGSRAYGDSSTGPGASANRSGSVATDPVDFPLDLCFVLVAPVEHVPGVHHQADPPTQDQEHGPEEPAVADRRPDRDDDGVDEHEHQ